MGKYLVKASYTADGVKGLLKDGGSGRRDAATQLLESLGGEVESFYFAFGSSDAYVVVDMPDNASAAAAALAVSSTGAVTTEIVVLLTPEEVDEACRKSPAYRPPGA
jgi:uncharacterized protein with GYD domain